MRRGRRDPDDLHVGDTVDFWRVEGLDLGRRLLLAAEMKIPGRLWLQFDVEDRTDGTQIRQTTVFDPAAMSAACTGTCSTPSITGSSGDVARPPPRQPVGLANDACPSCLRSAGRFAGSRRLERLR
jgi:hypothetical protein